MGLLQQGLARICQAFDHLVEFTRQHAKFVTSVGIKAYRQIIPASDIVRVHDQARKGLSTRQVPPAKQAV